MSERAEEAPAKPRRPWLAALLSLAWPGLGQLYNGEARRAAICFALLGLVFVLVAAVFPFIAEPRAFLVSAAVLMTAAIALSIGAAVDAFRRARRLGAVVPKAYQRGWVYVGIVVLWFGATEGLRWVAGSHGGCSPDVPDGFSHVYRIPSGSMRPTVLAGEIVVASTGYFCRNDPRRGDLALFLRPIKDSPIWVKRIVALPGDTVQIKAGRLFVNGEPVLLEWLESGIGVDESGQERERTRFVESFPDGARYVVEIADMGSPLENIPEVTVPPDRYFMLGDERDNSFDSRMGREFGFIPRALIVDRPAYVLWSSDRSRIGLRLR